MGYNYSRVAKITKIKNRNSGGGTKKQGLAPRVSCGHGPSTLRFFKRRSGPMTKKIYFINQLSGRVGSRYKIKYNRSRRH